MKNGSKNIAGVVKSIIAPTALSMGYVLWDVEYGKEGADYILRITLDKETGIQIDDCEAFSRAIDPILDAADPIDVAYRLEVSSPGVERELKTEAHIAACTGWNVDVKLYAPAADGAKSYRGILRGLDPEGHILLEIESKVIAIPRSAIGKIATYYDFEN